MLTFQFTGVDGSMTESDLLTSGMVSKTVQLLFDDSWAELTKTAVFRAGDTCRVVTDAASTVTIPTDVLARPFVRLYVGVYGTDAEGTIVIPTIMAEGPMIRYGADPIEDETAKELPVWENLQNQIGDLTGLDTQAREDLVSAVNELHGTLETMGDAAALETDARDTLVAAINELHSAQEAIGDPAGLDTDAKDTLVSAINELHGAQEAIGDAAALETDARDTLVAAINELHSAQEAIGDPAGLDTDAKDTLVSAVNEVHGQVEQLLRDCVGLSAAGAQLLVNILSSGVYNDDQSENIAALAAELGAEVPEDTGNLVLYWDFRTESWTDRIAGLEAERSEGATIDASGAHTAGNTDYIMVPIGLDGASLAGNVVEIKFGDMELVDTGTTMRLATACSGAQPATNGLMWSTKDCWTRSTGTVTEFTDLQMFSGKTLFGKPSEDTLQIHWYFEDQFICYSAPGYTPTHISLGCSSNGAYPLCVEYIKVYPGT